MGHFLSKFPVERMNNVRIHAIEISCIPHQYKSCRSTSKTDKISQNYSIVIQHMLLMFGDSCVIVQFFVDNV